MKSSPATVSIIIVNYNGDHHLEENLSSLKALDYPADALELIVYDNGSRDNSLGTVRKLWPSALIISSDHNTGFAAPHAVAAKKARGEVLALLNND
ncbi:MAG: glycosyltransferase, partial [Desulfamplus sp.]|nr:glycosyltransferase [Desulfamplus sp.]